MSEMQIFKNEEFGAVRTVSIENEIWFIANDIAEALGYRMASDMTRNLDIEDLHTHNVRTNAGTRKMTIMNESGLYAAILGSRLESAKKFKHWVTSEVLPSIRKNGGYIAGQETMSDDELLAKALMVAQNKIAEKDAVIQRQQILIEENKPKVIFADAVATSKTSILIGELAKIITQNGFNIGQKRLFDWMREKGYLMKNGESWNMPMQRYVEQGLFEIKESNIQNPDGSVRITKTTKVTGKGQQYFINKFIGATV